MKKATSKKYLISVGIVVGQQGRNRSDRRERPNICISLPQFVYFPSHNSAQRIDSIQNRMRKSEKAAVIIVLRITNN